MDQREYGTRPIRPSEQAGLQASLNRGIAAGALAAQEIVVDVDDHTCPCCGNALHRIGEDSGELLDIVPAQFRVLVVRRPKYACRACENCGGPGAAPARLIEGGLPTEATVAQDSFPNTPIIFRCTAGSVLRQAQGVDLHRSTLADRVGRAGLVRPGHELPADGA